MKGTEKKSIWHFFEKIEKNGKSRIKGNIPKDDRKIVLFATTNNEFFCSTWKLYLMALSDEYPENELVGWCNPEEIQ